MILVTKTSDQTRQRGHTLFTCTNLTGCVCVFSSHSFWTSSSLDVSRLRPLDTLAWNNEIGPRRSILLVCTGTIGYVVLPTGVSTDVSRDIVMPRQRDDDNNLSVGNRNHLKLGIEPESWLQSHELGF